MVKLNGPVVILKCLIVFSCVFQRISKVVISVSIPGVQVYNLAIDFDGSSVFPRSSRATPKLQRASESFLSNDRAFL